MTAQEPMSKEQFLEKLGELLGRAKSEIEAKVALAEAEELDTLTEEALQGYEPHTISVSIGKEGAPEHIVDVTMYTKIATGYELGFEGNIAHETELWPELVREAKNGFFDEDLFLDMASFAFEKLIAGAEGDTISRRDAYLARTIKEFADVDAGICEEFVAAQLVAEALSAQACGGWQKVDGEIPTDKLVVFKDGKRILVDMAPCDLSSLMAPAPVGTGM